MELTKPKGDVIVGIMIIGGISVEYSDVIKHVIMNPCVRQP